MATKKKVKKAVALSPKENLAAAKLALTTFLKENKLSRDEDHSSHKKLGKQYKELTLAVEKASDAMGETKTTKVEKTAKVKKEGAKSAGRGTQYDYPEGLTTAEKKEFRVKARREKKQSEKGTSPKAEKPAKVEKTEKAPKSKGGKKEETKVETKKVDSTKEKKKKKKVSKND